MEKNNKARMPLENPDADPKAASTMELNAERPRVQQSPRRIGPPDVIPEIDAPLHVAPCVDGWKLDLEGADTPLAVYPTKKEAMQTAKALVAERGARLVEHRADGTFR